MNKSFLNPLLTEDFMFGGMFGDSAGGQAASGALSGALKGFTMTGNPLGALGGLAIGGLTSLIGAKKEQQALLEQKQAEQKQNFMNFMGSSNLNQGNGSNMPMAYGGTLKGDSDIMNPLLVEFNTGGTHESNPLGGIPQGTNTQGQTRTVEQGETAFTFKGKDKYIFSNRLSPLSYDY